MEGKTIKEYTLEGRYMCIKFTDGTQLIFGAALESGNAEIHLEDETSIDDYELFLMDAISPEEYRSRKEQRATA